MLKGIFICQLIWIIVLLILSLTILFTNTLNINQYAMINFLYAYILVMLGIFTLIKNYIIKKMNKIKDNQELLIEKEKLSSLGQMIGGIAHNLKTPIFSITGGLEALADLSNEYDSSIDDKKVTNKDHHEIAKEMIEWIEKLKSHVSYMSDIISTLKQQTIAESELQDITFNITELLNHVSILMQYELKKNLAILKIENNIPDDIKIKGNINSLVQVINNLISNAIEAYTTDKEKDIELTANYIENNIIITVKDYGSGISKNVQKKLFKEMITTKGKYGTGLGLLISHTTIKASFKGSLSFKTSDLETTFTISIPSS